MMSWRWLAGISRGAKLEGGLASGLGDLGVGMGLAGRLEDRSDVWGAGSPQVVKDGRLLSGRAELLQVLDQPGRAVGVQDRGQRFGHQQHRRSGVEAALVLEAVVDQPV